MTTPISFFVQGIAKPAGSKRGFYIAKITRVVITDACKGSRDWKTDVKHTAQSVYQGALITGPVMLSLTFQVLRPKGHFRTGVRANELRESAPAFPIVKPDVLKLARGVEDALTGIIWKDDAQIVSERLEKVYGAVPGVRVEVKEIL